MLFDKRVNCQKALCPTLVKKHQPVFPSPSRLDATEAVQKHHLGRTRAAMVRSHWQRAKRLYPSLSKHDYKAWFIAALDNGKVPKQPVKRLLWLIKVRDCHIAANNNEARLKLNAAIWRETKNARNKKIPKTDR